MFNKCKHNWELISEKTTTSKAEHLASIVGKVPQPNNRYDLREMTSRKFIQLLECKECGKLRRYVENI